MSQYLGDISAYALAVSQGYTGTEEEYAELMASYATVGQTAVTAAQTATTKASEAATSAATATNKASEATTAATTATTKAAEASTSASTATSAKDTAVSASQTATSKATEATTAATTATSAKTDAVAANTAAQSAKTAAQTAQTGAETAAASVSASAAQIATNAADISQLKSEFTALESDGVVPSAEQILTDKGITDSVPYHFRKTASDNADREELEIVGGSVAWNQFCYNGDLASSEGWAAQEGTLSIANGVATLTKTYASNSVSFRRSNASYPDAIGTRSFIGHVYYASAFVKTPKDTAGCFYIFNVLSNNISLSANVEKHIGGIVKLESASDDGFNVYYDRLTAMSVDETATIRNVMLCDLTVMFGSTIADHIYALEQATAGAGVALFRSLFSRDYYAYDAGSMQGVSGLSEHRMAGFNQWNEEWEVGAYALSDGQKSVDNSRIRNKNFIHVFPSTSYCNGCPQIITALFYDSDKNYIGQYGYNSGQVFVTPARAQYMNFYVAQSYGNVYKNDICINLSDPAKNGTYEPYESHSYALDDSLTLRGIPTLVDGKIKWDGDVYSADGTVTRRYGIVDLGTKYYGYNSSAKRYELPLPGLKITSSRAAIIFAEKYVTDTQAETGDSGKCFAYNGGLYFYDATQSGTPTGVLVYELATPTTEQADPYVSPQICSPYGTEEFVSTGIVPVGHVTKYPDNLRMKLDNLPWNFASLIAPTESGYTATRNYTTGQLLIVNNVLYKVTANIANGGTITPNTNVTATTLAEVIAALS